MTVKCIQSSLIKNVKHGFFTRRGGSSLGIYKGLNCGLGSKDHKENVKVECNNDSLVCASGGGSPIGLQPEKEALADSLPGRGLANAS